MIKLGDMNTWDFVAMEGFYEYYIDVDEEISGIDRKVSHEVIKIIIDLLYEYNLSESTRTKVLLNLSHEMRLKLYEQFLIVDDKYGAREIRDLDNEVNNRQYDGNFSAIYYEYF